MIDVAILGATGAVGQRFVALLEGHPYFRVAELAASERSAGQPYGTATRWLLPGSVPRDIAPLRVQTLDAPIQSPLVFSALPPEVAGEREDALATMGHIVSTNARNHRMDDDVPLLIPEVNPDHVGAIEAQKARRGSQGYIVANANCSTIVLTLALKPLHDMFGLESVIVTTMQSISGAGYPGVPSLDILDNVVPYIGGEEDKLRNEPRKILGTWSGGFIEASFIVSAQCNRVPTIDGHLISVSIKFSGKHSATVPTVDAVTDCLRTFEPPPIVTELPSAARPVIRVADSADRPQTRLDRDAGGGMAVTVGRIDPCPVLDTRLVVLGHNTIRGAAGGAIINAELLYASGLL